MAVEVFLGNPPADIVDWIRNHSQPVVEPSPYFTYDSNRVITGLHQGSPNIYVEGTYEDQNSGEQIPYSGWTYSGSNVTDEYALGIANSAFEDTDYGQDNIPPSRAVSGQLSFPNITSIGNNAFSYCDRLTSVTIPNSVTSIGDGAFYNCTNLTNVTIPDGITSIENWTFSYCSSLQNITIPSSVTSIGIEVFNGCSSLTSVTFQGKTLAQVQEMDNYPWNIGDTSIINVA